MTMTKTSHTSKPWVISDECEDIYVYASQAHKIVCEVTVTNPNYAHPESVISKAEALVNARLIAAAPDLLAALQACLLRLDSHDQQSAPEALKARAAIAKAGG